MHPLLDLPANFPLRYYLIHLGSIQFRFSLDAWWVTRSGGDGKEDAVLQDVNELQTVMTLICLRSSAQVDGRSAVQACKT